MNDNLEMQKFVPRLVWYRPFEPFAYAFIRFSTGAIIASHGFARTFLGTSSAELGGVGSVLAGGLGPVELIGGIALALGLLTRPLALLFALEWLAISVAVPVRPGSSWFMLGATPHYPAFVLVLCIAILLRGGGQYSIDRRLGKEL